jgi:hypothetical protein
MKDKMKGKEDKVERNKRKKLRRERRWRHCVA